VELVRYRASYIMGGSEGEERAALLDERYEPPSSPDSLGGGASYVSILPEDGNSEGQPRTRSYAGIQDSARPSPTESEAYADEQFLNQRQQQPGSLTGLRTSRRSYKDDDGEPEGDVELGEIVPDDIRKKPVEVAGYDGHGEGGDPSRCPFASLIAEAEAEIAARTAPTPFNDVAVSGEYAKVRAATFGEGFATGKTASGADEGAGKHAGRFSGAQPESYGASGSGKAGGKQSVRYGSFQAGSVAPSASSQHSENSEALGAAFLSNADTANLGLAKLNRSEWNMDVCPYPHTRLC
jgi:hypothetical protein